MVHNPKNIRALVLRLIVGLALLGSASVGSAQGTWSVISLPQQPGEVLNPRGLAVDMAGNLYVADQVNGGRIQKRDAQGNWSVIATHGTALGQVDFVDFYLEGALTVDGAGNLYVAEFWHDRIQKRDAQGNWSVIATYGYALGQVVGPTDLAVDGAGNLYVADDYPNYRIQKRDDQGNWSVIATKGTGIGQVAYPTALAADTAGNLYLADWPLHDGAHSRIQKRDAQGNWSVIAMLPYAGALTVDGAGNLYVVDSWLDMALQPYVYVHRIQKRDAQGNWSVLATGGSALGQVGYTPGLVVDPAGNLYVADNGNQRIQKRDAQGNWSVIATAGTAPGQVWYPSALAADSAGNLYVAEYYPGRIQKRDAQGNWSVIATYGTALGQVFAPTALAVDTAGNLYVAEEDWFTGKHRVQRRDAQGNWSVIATSGDDPGQVAYPLGLAVDTAGNLYVADAPWGGRIQKRDGQGNWSVIATAGQAIGQVWFLDWSDAFIGGLAADTAGSLYVADEPIYDGAIHYRIQKRDAQGNWSVIATYGAYALAADTAGNLYAAGGPIAGGAIQKRDAQGNWSVIASYGDAVGQIYFSDTAGLAVDAAGNLYVADTYNNRVQMYTPQP